MQKPKSTKTYCRRNKLYVNSSGLIVRGESVRLLKTASRSAATTRSPHVESRAVDGKQNTARAPVRHQSSRSEAKLNVSVYDSEKICNAKLERIRETAEIEEEFRRYLDTLGGKNSRNTKANKSGDAKILRQIYAEVYEEFFGVYYRQLKELIATHNNNNNK